MRELSPEVQRFIAAEVASGKFTDDTAVIEAAVRQFRNKDSEQERVREKIAKAYESVRQGGWIEFASDEEWNEYWDGIERGASAPALPRQA